MIRARSTNILVSSPVYPRILEEYNAQFKATGGRVNNRKFWDEVIHPVLPTYNINTWFSFIRRFKSDSLGMIPARPLDAGITKPPEQEIELHQNLLSNEIATQKGIKSALNLGAKFYEDLWQKYQTAPETLTLFEQRILADSLHKAMKSQDSRIHAIGKMKEDSREQAKFERAFEGAAFKE